MVEATVGQTSVLDAEHRGDLAYGVVRRPQEAPAGLVHAAGPREGLENLWRVTLWIQAHQHDPQVGPDGRTQFHLDPLDVGEEEGAGIAAGCVEHADEDGMAAEEIKADGLSVLIDQRGGDFIDGLAAGRGGGWGLLM